MKFKEGDWIVQPGKSLQEVYRVIGLHGKGYRVTVVLFGSDVRTCLRAKRCRAATPEEISRAVVKRIEK